MDSLPENEVTRLTNPVLFLGIHSIQLVTQMATENIDSSQLKN